MAGGIGDIGEMLRQISANPAASEMLANILGKKDGEEPQNKDVNTENSSDKEEDSAPASTFSIPVSTRSHARGRREMLSTLRPYLGARRAASVDRMIRALELYEIIEETRLLRGGDT